MGESDRTDAYSSFGNSVIFASGRFSYAVQAAQGPSLVIDTACSASLIGVHLACESLRGRSSDLALAGGVHVVLSPQGHIAMSQMQALAPDGRSKTFDASANGFGRGEGCGIVVLKRLSDAQADGDPILALIRGSATNHDGPSSGLTVPSATAQAALIRLALADGKSCPQTKFCMSKRTAPAQRWATRSKYGHWRRSLVSGQSPVGRLSQDQHRSFGRSGRHCWADEGGFGLAGE